MAKKGQITTEYLILLFVAMVIALIVVGIVAGLAGFNSDSAKKGSEIYWKSAYPIAVEAVQVQNVTSP